MYRYYHGDKWTVKGAWLFLPGDNTPVSPLSTSLERHNDRRDDNVTRKKIYLLTPTDKLKRPESRGECRGGGGGGGPCVPYLQGGHWAVNFIVLTVLVEKRWVVVSITARDCIKFDKRKVFSLS